MILSLRVTVNYWSQVKVVLVCLLRKIIQECKIYNIPLGIKLDLAIRCEPLWLN